MDRLDKTRPHGALFGESGHYGFEQDGRKYRLDGSPMQEAKAAAAPKPAAESAPVPAPTSETGGVAAARAMIAALSWPEIQKRYRAVFGKAPPKKDTAIDELAKAAAGDA